MRALAVLTVRNEAAFLLEWLAHHRAIGVTDFLVFSNNCQDGTDDMLDRLAQMGWLTHLRNDGPYDARGVQFTALKSAEKHPLVRQSDWILPMDIDEFVNIHTGDGTIAALTEALPDATAIPLTWRVFGNGGQVTYQDKPVTETFTAAAPSVLHWPWRAAMFKTLYRNNGDYKKLGVHRPRQLQPLAQPVWRDGSGRLLGKDFHSQRIFSDFGQDNFQLAQLNHYPLGAMESYVLKSDRGRAVHSDQKLGMDYWVERNFGDAQDTSILRFSEQRETIQIALLSDRPLADLHQKAVLWRKARLQQLMLKEDNRALYSRLLMTPISHSISKENANILRGHRLREMALEKHKSS